MSQTDLHQLSKKNQEFIRIAKHQLLENGKSEEEAESLIQIRTMTARSTVITAR